MSIRTRRDSVCSHTTPCSLSRRNAVCPRAGVVAEAAPGVALKFNLSLFIVLERDGAVLDGARDAEEADDEEEDDEDEVVDAEEEEVFCRCCTALALSSPISSCTVSFRLLLTMPLNSPPAPVLDRDGV